MTDCILHHRRHGKKERLEDVLIANGVSYRLDEVRDEILSIFGESP